MRSVLNQVKMEVHDAAASLAAAQEQVGIARIGMQAATKEIELAKERYAVMTAASHFELTNGLSALARARENLVNALFQLNAGRVNLARSTGSLKDAELAGTSLAKQPYLRNEIRKIRLVNRR